MQNDESATSRKVAIVTGAARRIGACTAKMLHKSGYNVLVHYRASKEPALDLVAELNSDCADSALGMQAELQQESSANSIVNAAIEHWGRLDLLVNNASEFYPTKIQSITADDISQLFGTNFQAPLLLSQAAFPHLKEHSGAVVNIVDIYSATVHKEHSVYCASKAALSMLTKSFAVEFAPEVRVNGVSPGAILWPEGQAGITEAQKKRIVDAIPLERIGDASDIAEAVLYLATAQFVTGQIMTVDGGRTL